ncbi:MAG: lysylphosphatidylglycerol synthase domain-containing protein [Bacteroidetes bacterium]|nr:lysylphosphatidylglycerol synthase domain-containing protein [Bacteroidota bacterium]
MKKKYKILINWVVGPIIFIWFSFSIYNQITHQPHLKDTWKQIFQFTTKQKVYVAFAFLLMFLNWGLETKKWQILIKDLEQIKFLKAFRAVFSGQAFALNTINNLGEYVGRVLFLKEGNRLKAVSLTMVGSLSQVLITFIMGFIALFFSRILFHQTGLGNGGINTFLYTGLMFVLLTCTVLLTMVYYSLSWITKAVEKLWFVKRYAFLIQLVENFTAKDLTKILVLSFVRYIVFVVQYLLLLDVFKVEANPMLLALMVCVFLLILAIVPTIALTEMGFRGTISIQLIGMLSTNNAGILFTAAAIWFINRVFPALAGSLFMIGIKVFKR